MAMISNPKVAKSSNFFYCKKCEYKTLKKNNYEKHLLTLKHFQAMVSNPKVATREKVAKSSNPHYKCSHCSKEYSDNSGLWRHKKKCFTDIELTKLSSQLPPHLVMKLIEQNTQLQNTLLEQNKNIIELSKNSGNNTNITNSNNKTFNLQLFLNDTCKDAINLSDFINQIKVSMGDLEETGRIGYAEGISKVFIKNLNDLEDDKRPIHCSDSKRTILYIKDDNQWSKDTDESTQLTKAIKTVAHKNIKQISEWQKQNPHFSDPASKQNDKYQKIVSNSMSGSTQEEADKNYEKIIKNIAKEVIIDK